MPAPSVANTFLAGVIEGFYGRPWTLEARLAYANYLHLAGLNTYLYCPKSDPYLRRLWAQDWPRKEWHDLQLIGNTYRQKGLLWGLGLSPFELYREYDAGSRAKLRAKVERISELEAPLLAILFDDMPGNVESLAERQAEIVCDVQHWESNARILVCPTYYSFDPVLETHFGAMPNAYWRELGGLLPADVDIFWTGNLVCSERISSEDIRAANAHLGRPVTLWDNYPVNDGAKRSRFLYTSPLARRGRVSEERLRGHLCNPMNQPLLSLPALQGLAQLYGRPGLTSAQLEEFLGRDCWHRLLRDSAEFQEIGLDGMGEERSAELRVIYASFGTEAAAEVVDWLDDKYRFDPACLTD